MYYWRTQLYEKNIFGLVREYGKKMHLADYSEVKLLTMYAM